MEGVYTLLPTSSLARVPLEDDEIRLTNNRIVMSKQLYTKLGEPGAMKVKVVHGEIKLEADPGGYRVNADHGTARFGQPTLIQKILSYTDFGCEPPIQFRAEIKGEQTILRRK